jgi:hypothetical protein
MQTEWIEAFGTPSPSSDIAIAPVAPFNDAKPKETMTSGVVPGGRITEPF